MSISKYTVPVLIDPPIISPSHHNNLPAITITSRRQSLTQLESSLWWRSRFLELKLRQLLWDRAAWSMWRKVLRQWMALDLIRSDIYEYLDTKGRYCEPAGSHFRSGPWYCPRGSSDFYRIYLTHLFTSNRIQQRTKTTRRYHHPFAPTWLGIITMEPKKGKSSGSLYACLIHANKQIDALTEKILPAVWFPLVSVKTLCN